MAEIFEERDLDLIARLAAVQVIDDVIAVLKIDQIQVECVAHGTEKPEQILLFLRGPVDVTLLVDQPGDLRVRTVFFAQLLGANAGRPDEICPPMVVREGAFVFLPLHQGRAAHQKDKFRRGVCGARGHGGGQGQKHEKKEEREAFHGDYRSSIYAHTGKPQGARLHWPRPGRALRARGRRKSGVRARVRSDRRALEPPPATVGNCRWKP